MLSQLMKFLMNRMNRLNWFCSVYKTGSKNKATPSGSTTSKEGWLCNIITTVMAKKKDNKHVPLPTPCPKCGSTKTKHNGKSRGKSRIFCNGCNRYSTLAPSKRGPKTTGTAMSNAERQAAYRMRNEVSGNEARNKNSSQTEN